MDANKLEFKDCSFDVVVSSGVVGLTGPKSIDQMYRVVKVGGLIACTIVELNNNSGAKKRFHNSCTHINYLSGQKLKYVDLGTGYSGERDDEHHVLYIFRRE